MVALHLLNCGATSRPEKVKAPIVVQGLGFRVLRKFCGRLKKVAQEIIL